MSYGAVTCKKGMLAAPRIIIQGLESIIVGKTSLRKVEFLGRCFILKNVKICRQREKGSYSSRVELVENGWMTSLENRNKYFFLYGGVA